MGIYIDLYHVIIGELHENKINYDESSDFTLTSLYILYISLDKGQGGKRCIYRVDTCIQTIISMSGLACFCSRSRVDIYHFSKNYTGFLING